MEDRKFSEVHEDMDTLRKILKRMVWIMLIGRGRKRRRNNKIKISQRCYFYRETYSLLNIEKLESGHLICM